MKILINPISVTMLTALLVLTGCASIPTGGDARPNIPVENDKCEQYRSPLREVDEANRQAIQQYERAKSAAMIAGGVATLMCLLKKHDNKEKCLAFLFATGTAMIFLDKKQEIEMKRQKETKENLAIALNNSSATFAKKLDPIGKTIKGLEQCRRDQINTVTTDYRAHRINKKTAQTQLGDIQRKREGDISLINPLLDQNHQMITTQIDTVAQINGVAPDYYTRVPTGKPPSSKPPRDRRPHPSKKKIPLTPQRGGDETRNAYNKTIQLEQNVKTEQNKTYKALDDAMKLVS